MPQGTAYTAREGVANAVAAADAAGAHAATVIRAAQLSFVDGWQQALWAAAAVMGALFLLVLTRGFSSPVSAPRDATATTAPNAIQ